jgi:hypothetical protein
MFVNSLTTPPSALMAQPPSAGPITRRAALGGLAVVACGHALVAGPTADPLVLVDGWLVRLSDIKPATLHASP